MKGLGIYLSGSAYVAYVGPTQWFQHSTGAGDRINMKVLKLNFPDRWKN